MKQFFFIFCSLLHAFIFAQEKISVGNYRLWHEVYYELPISQAIFAKNTDKQAAWVLISQEELLPAEQKEEAAMIVDMVSISDAVSETISDTESSETYNTSPSNSALNTEKEQKSLYFIQKPDNSKIDLWAGDRFVYGTENEIVTYNDAQKKIRRFEIGLNEISLKDSVVYSEMMTFSSWVQVQKSPKGQVFFISCVWSKGENLYTIFNEKLEKLHTFPLQKNRNDNSSASFSVFSEQEMRIFYADEKQYHILNLNTETAKYQEVVGNCACTSSALSSMGIVETKGGEYIVYHACYDSRGVILYAYNSENKLKWTQKLKEYYTDFQYITTTNSVIGNIYSVPYSGFINVSAEDGKTLEEKSIINYLLEMNASPPQQNWVVYMPYQMQSFANGKKTICLLNCYSPTEPNFQEYKLLTFDGKKADNYDFPINHQKSYIISTLSEKRILAINGSRVAIYESNP